MPNCTCPPSDAIPSISLQDCPEKYGNINRFVIGRVSGGAFTAITDETEFDTRLAAVDATKIVLTPLLSETDFPFSALISEGGDDNTTPFGEPIRVGEGSITVTSLAKNVESSIKDELKELECYTDLAIGIIESNGGIGAIGATALIPIANLFVSTKSFGGISASDSVQISFTLRPNWDEGLQLNSLTWDIYSK